MPIFFQRLKTEEGKQVKDYLDRKAELFSLASTRSLPVIIALSERLNKRILAQHIQFFHDRLHGLPPRLADIYSVYRLILFEVIQAYLLLQRGNIYTIRHLYLSKTLFISVFFLLIILM
jgi:hypothetical protein